MHKKMHKVALVIVCALTLAAVTPVAAQGVEEPEVPPCEGESVAGTVVAVDEEAGTATVDVDGSLCTVSLGGEYEHPIVALLGSYFGDVDLGSLAEAQEATQGCAVEGDDGWVWADCEEEGAVEVTVVSDNEDGTFEFTATVDGEEVTGTVAVDEDTAAGLSEALQALVVEWELGEDGALAQVGDEITAYHEEEGMGFGVLVKLYAMAAESDEACAGEEPSDEPCGVSVGELVEAFQSGVGLGKLFKDYGKPSMLGVGHVKQYQKKHQDQEGDEAGPPDHAGPKDKDKDKDNGPPDHAGPKPNAGEDDEDGGPPPHAGPKDKGKKKDK